MTTFNDLPLELLPSIVQHAVHPRSLTSFCLVNKTFCKFTQPFLYHTIAVCHWHSKDKILKTFRTLFVSPELAKHVRILEIRNFPITLDDLGQNGLIACCLRGLANTVNLRCCIWTRDGSVRSSVLRALLKHSSLQELEINGRHSGNYDHRILPRFTGLRRIKLNMPTPPVIGILPAWLGSLVEPLRSLSIVCKGSTAITDEFLEKISGHLSGLDELKIKGCQKVTHEGLASVLRHNKNGIKKLSAESISPLLDLRELHRRCRKERLFNRLTSLTISITYTLFGSTWMEDMPELVSSSPLECLQLHCTTIIEKLEETQLDGLVATLISTHGPRLKHLSMHRLPISLKVLHDVCTGFKNLEHLFVVVEPTDLGPIGNSLSKATQLRAIHINSVVKLGDAIAFSYASPEDALQIVKQCSPTVTQIGCGGRVWQVVREVTPVGENKTTIVELAPNDRSEVPDRFRVMYM